MFTNGNVKLTYLYNGHKESVTFSAKEQFTNGLILCLVSSKNEVNEERYTLEIESKEVIELLDIKLEMKNCYLSDDKVFVNGFQSWTDSKELGRTQKIKGISKLAKPIMNKYAFNKYGDYSFVHYTKKKGDFHGFTYSYIRNKHKMEILGSLSENNGYTIFYHQMRKNKITIAKDIEGKTIKDKYTIFDLYYRNGTEKEVFDGYFDHMEIEKPRFKKMKGWTSWYNYYENISEQIILNNLNTIYDKKKAIDIFQIDDGFEVAVGDWLDVDLKKFPRGMKPLATAIKEKGYKSGIWLAPFVCETKSKIFKEKPDWLLRDRHGDLVLAGSNWSRFYALDIYNEEVRNYIREVFKTVLDDWGFDMVKLDFLYAISLIMQHNKTRGQVMCEGMDFLRQCVGEKIILGCGVPLGPSFGKVDYCRIGCDVGLDWDDKWFMRLLHRERISTKNAIYNSIFRRQLDNRGFLNDPDVFLLREDNISLSIKEKKLLSIINQLFGSLIFTSDDISKYDKETEIIFDNIMNLHLIEILWVDEIKEGNIVAKLIENDIKYGAFFNLTAKTTLVSGKLLEAYEYIIEKSEDV